MDLAIETHDLGKCYGDVKAVENLSLRLAQGEIYAFPGLVEDMFLWDQALSKDCLLPQSLRDLLFTPYVSIPDSDASYGYGWGVGNQFNHRWVGHAGSIPGFQSEIDRYPDDKVVIIVLSNREDTNVGLVASDIAQMIFGKN